jgi:hypothetical protein
MFKLGHLSMISQQLRNLRKIPPLRVDEQKRWRASFDNTLLYKPSQQIRAVTN